MHHTDPSYTWFMHVHAIKSIMVRLKDHETNFCDALLQ